MSVSRKPEEKNRRSLAKVVVKENAKTCHQSSCLKRVKGQTSAAPIVPAAAAVILVDSQTSETEFFVFLLPCGWQTQRWRLERR